MPAPALCPAGLPCPERSAKLHLLAAILLLLLMLLLCPFYRYFRLLLFCYQLLLFWND